MNCKCGLELTVDNAIPFGTGASGIIVCPDCGKAYYKGDLVKRSSLCDGSK